ncbi:hypothetical protein D3C76_959260 [compost metagenome]
MFYLKTEIDGQSRKVEIYDDEVFTTCFMCGKEFNPDPETMKFIYEEGGDLASTSLSCGCSDKPKLVRIK